MKAILVDRVKQTLTHKNNKTASIKRYIDLDKRLQIKGISERTSYTGLTPAQSEFYTHN